MAKTKTKGSGKVTAPKKANKLEADWPATVLNRFVMEVITGYHPRLCHQHILTRYDNGQIRIKRSDLITINPATKAEERQSFEILYESFDNHQWLWETIKNNPNPCQQER